MGLTENDIDRFGVVAQKDIDSFGVVADKDIDRFGVVAQKDIGSFGVVADKDIERFGVVADKDHQQEQFRQSELTSIQGMEKEAVKEELHVPAKNTKNYSCSNFKFTCVGHDTLKDHIMSTQIAQAQAKVSTNTGEVKSTEKTENTSEGDKKLIDDIEKLKMLKKGLIENTPYGCKHCNLVLSNDIVFKNHNDTFHSNRCQKCNINFNSGKELRSHTKECLFKCKYCDKKVKNKRDFDRHVASKHMSVINGEVVEKIKEEIGIPLLMEVEKASLEENEPDDGFTCELCGETGNVYKGVTALKAHLDIDHC